MIQTNLDGLVLLDKPIGITSFQSLNIIKKKLNIKKVGHTGTLDKFASGLLVVVTGKLTKLASLIESQYKSYQAEAQFGIETDTLDIEGEIVKKTKIPTRDQIEKAAKKYCGTYDQIPPLFSALKINGKRASSRIRSGEKIVLKSRKVHIKSLKINNYERGILSFSVTCSKGTYIRSLARDLATACNSSAHLIQLRRTKVGFSDICDAIIPSEFNPTEHLITGSALFKFLPNIEVFKLQEMAIPDAFELKLKYGKSIEISDFKRIPKKKYFVILNQEKYLAIFENKDEKFIYKINWEGF